MPAERPPAVSGPLVLAVAYAYLPNPAPEAIRVHGLLAAAGLPVVLLRGQDYGHAHAAAGQDAPEFLPQAEVLVAHGQGPGLKSRLMARLGFPSAHRPGWAQPAVAACLAYLERSGQRPQVVLSFAPPLCGHVAGRALARELGLPWAAYCLSDAPPQGREARLLREAGMVLWRNQEMAGRFADQSGLTKSLVLEGEPDQAGAHLGECLRRLAGQV